MKPLTRNLLYAAAAGVGAAAIGRVVRQARAMRFAGRSVLIMGGSRGLALAVARVLSSEGAHLTLAARDEDELARAASDLTPRGGRVLTTRCDVTHEGQVRRAVEAAVARYGGVDILINNAGIMDVGPVEHMDLDDFRAAMDVHFWGPLYAMTAAFPHLRDSECGRVVNVASIGGRIAIPHLAPYIASKFALVGLSDALRAEWAKHGVRVTTVTPGLMRTGSYLNARFRGRRAAELRWFSTLDSLPLVSIDAGRAARKIVEACRHGQPHLYITPQAHAAAVANGLFPGLVGRGMQLLDRLLPRVADGDGEGGARPQSGWDSREEDASDEWLRTWSHRATNDLNELAGHDPIV